MITGKMNAQIAVAIETFIKYTSAHTHRARQDLDREDPKVHQLLQYKEKEDEGARKVASCSPSKNQSKLRSTPDRCQMGCSACLSSRTEISTSSKMYSRGKLLSPLQNFSVKSTFTSFGANPLLPQGQ